MLKLVFVSSQRFSELNVCRMRWIIEIVFVLSKRFPWLVHVYDKVLDTHDGSMIFDPTGKHSSSGCKGQHCVGYKGKIGWDCIDRMVLGLAMIKVGEILIGNVSSRSIREYPVKGSDVGGTLEHEGMCMVVSCSH